MPLYTPSSGVNTSTLVIRAPATASQNTVTPTADIPAITLVGGPAATGSLMEWYKSDGTTLIGKVFANDTNKRVQIGGAGYTGTLGNAVLHIFSDLATQQVVRFIGRIGGASGGAGIQALQDTGAAVASGSRLGYLLIGGAKDASATLANQAGFEVFATEAWGSTATGCEIRFETTHNTTTTRKTRMTLQEGGGMFVANADAVPATPVGGGVFYVTGGALHYIGSSGTDTPIAPA